MDKFARRFIIMSILYLGVSTAVGVVLLGGGAMPAWKFVHSHLMMLGWVSMMIYGVGYHILPRFMGRPLYSQKMGNVQFWLANIGLVLMLFFYTLNAYQPSSLFTRLTVSAGIVEGVSIFLFFYNMLMTLLPKAEA